MIAAEVMVPCFSITHNCRPDWAAVSAIGGWIAAAATFVAVIVPVLLGNRKERVRNHLALVDFVHDLPTLVSHWRRCRTVLKRVAGAKNGSFHPQDFDGLTLGISVPPLEPSMRMKAVLVAFKFAGREIAGWNTAVAETRDLASRLSEGLAEDPDVEGLLDFWDMHLHLLVELAESLEDRLAELFHQISLAEPTLAARIDYAGQRLRG